VDRGAKGEAVAVAIDVIQPFVPFRSVSFRSFSLRDKRNQSSSTAVLELELSPGLRGGEGQ